MNHPPALRTFFATEMWERYGFYVLQSLLALQLALRFHWADHEVYALVGAFTGLTYLSPIIGGWIADRYLGQKRAILLGAGFLFISYASLACMQTATYLKFALATTAIGTGLLKPNISSLLGHAYPANSPQRENGFTIFYMGLTTGIIFGTTLPSYLQHTFGWPATFLSAAIGIVIAFFTFYLGMRHYKIQDYHDVFHPTRSLLLKVTACLCGAWGICLLVLTNTTCGIVVFISILLISLYFVLHAARQESEQQAKRTKIIGLLCLISGIYWSFYFQMFSSLTLFITRLVTPHIGSLTFPAPYYVCAESIGMLIFGYFLSRPRPLAPEHNSAFRASRKFFISILCIAAAYGTLILSLWLTPSLALVSPFIIIGAYLLISLSELLLSPVGLSIVTELADRKRVSTLMGIFFVSLSLGGYLSGFLAQTTSITALADMSTLKAHYLHGFMLSFYLLCGAITASFFIQCWIQRLSK